jgi:hypothetical protein
MAMLIKSRTIRKLLKIRQASDMGYSTFGIIMPVPRRSPLPQTYAY